MRDLVAAVLTGVRYSAGFGGRRWRRGAPFGRWFSDMSVFIVPGGGLGARNRCSRARRRPLGGWAARAAREPTAAL